MRIQEVLIEAQKMIAFKISLSSSVILPSDLGDKGAPSWPTLYAKVLSVIVLNSESNKWITGNYMHRENYLWGIIMVWDFIFFP